MNLRFVFCIFILQTMAAWTPVQGSTVCLSGVQNHTSRQSDIDAEFENIRNKFRTSICSNIKPNAKKLDIIVKTIKEDGSWPNINYVDVSRKGFRHTNHLLNMKLLASAYNTPEQDFFHNKEIKSTFDKALNFWLKHDFKAENWWHNEFGTPNAMKDLLLMMDNELTETQVDKMVQIASRANSNAPGARASGDRISIIGIEAQVALFCRDTDKFKQCIEGISKEIRFGASDGSKKCLQHDYSFHHRKDRVNNTLSYGLQYANDLALWMDKVAGTQYEFPESSVKLLIDFYLDGICKHMVYGKYEDTGHMNRDISREKAFAPMNVKTPQRLMNASDYRKDELQTIIDLRKGNTETHSEFAKFFWQSEYLTVQRKDFFTSVRMFSSRNNNMEIAYNGEGLKNHYRGDGTNYLTLKGDEYHALPPVYDWMRIPGTTSVITSEMPSFKEIQKPGTMDFVGAVTDGYYASAAFNFTSPHHALHAKKSWFFFDNEYLCLGSDINSETDNEVVTTLNQTALRGDVTTNKGVLKEGSHHLDNIKWLTHDKVTYIFPYAQNVYVSNQAETGHWSDISSQTNASKKEMTEKVMKLWISHKSNCHNKQYAYIVTINKELNEIKKYVKGEEITILANNSKVQAAEKRRAGISYAHFYEPGSLSFNGKNKLKMSTPGLVMIKCDKKGNVKSISCSDPTRKLKEINFILNGKHYYVVLKSGDYAGTTETIIIE